MLLWRGEPEVRDESRLARAKEPPCDGDLHRLRRKAERRRLLVRRRDRVRRPGNLGGKRRYDREVDRKRTEGILIVSPLDDPTQLLK
jgi:hypothetical protein